MDVVEDIRRSDTNYPNVVMTVGSFDGIHLGHRSILERVVSKAREIGGTPAVLTMQPHPREFFAPGQAPNLLTSFAKKRQLLEEAGIEVLYVLPFDRDTADMEPKAFVEEILCGHCHATAIVVGHDCRFGKGAQGDFEYLENAAPKYGFSVEEVPPLYVETERVSSTLVRERVIQGDMARVETLLGRKYSVLGEVQPGRGIGVTLGFPTANIKPDHNAVPAQGVYIAEALVKGRRLPAAVNIGIAPTIRHEDVTIEAHLLDFSEDITGCEIEIVFHRRIRPEKKFAGREELQEQIGRDVEAVRAHFAPNFN